MPYIVRLRHLPGLLLAPLQGTLFVGTAPSWGTALLGEPRLDFSPHLSPVLNTCPTAGGNPADKVLRPEYHILKGKQADMSPVDHGCT